MTSQKFSIETISLFRNGLVALVCLTALPGCYAQTITASVPTGKAPWALAANPVTNKIYVTNESSNNVTVIDGATNTTATVPTGLTPTSVAVNPVTNKIYVGNYSGGNVTVIDGATNTTATVPAGSTPASVAVNPVTNKIYVANQGGKTVTVVDGATNNTTTVTTGSAPGAVAVNPVTNKIYVANVGSVTVIDGATNGTTTVAAGSTPYSLAVNPVTNKIYVANQGSQTVTVIDGATNNTTTVTTTGAGIAVAVNPVTNKIYVANSGGGVTVIDGATNNATTVTTTGAGIAVAVNSVTNRIYVANSGVTVIDGATNTTMTVAAATPRAVAVNPVTNKIYVPNFNGNTVTVIDGATNNSTIALAGSYPYASAVNPVTNQIYVVNGDLAGHVIVIDGATNTTSSVGLPSGQGSDDIAVAVNPVTDRTYVVNQLTNNVTVIGGGLALVPVGSAPQAVAVNPVTNKIYVVNEQSNNVTVINGATNSTTTVATGFGPQAVGVNPVTNKIYVANPDIGGGRSSVTVIDGATNSTTTVTEGFQPMAVGVNPVTNKIYFANLNGNVTVLDGATNNTTTVSQGGSALAVAVNPVTNKIYAAGANVTVIDGATNSATILFGSSGEISGPQSVAVNPVTNKIYFALGANVTEIDGATNSVVATVAGAGINSVAVNPVTNKIYATNDVNSLFSVTVITEQQVQAIPLTTSIAPLPENQTFSPSPAFTFSVTDSFSPIATVPDKVFYQTDTWQNSWSVATGSNPSYSGTLAPILPGFHILYAFAGDSQEASEQASLQSSSPLIGTIQAYGFLVLPNPPTLQVSVTKLVYPGGANVTVCVTAVASGPVAGAVQILDGTTLLATLPVQENGCAEWYISPGLNAGIHSLTAFYSGDGNNPPGTSNAVTVTVNPVPSNLGASCGNASFPYGGNYNCTVNVGSAAGAATGAITYTLDGNAPVSLPLSNGMAKFSLTRPDVAVSYLLVIGYAQQGNFAGGNRAVLHFTVTPAITQLSLTPSSYNPTAGSSFTLSASVTSDTAGPPASGTVTFLDNNYVIGTGTVDAQGRASFTIPSIPAGQQSFYAQFGGLPQDYAASGASNYLTISPK